MYIGVISKYIFELDVDTNRIMVHVEGAGVDPIAFINVKPSITEKDFHYEIMSWASDNSNTR
jgi:hypothetical protein